MTARELHELNAAVKESYRDNITGKLLANLDYTTNGADGFSDEWDKYQKIKDREVVGIFTYMDSKRPCIGAYLF